MSALHAVILGFVQGFTEFLPVSSSGHLILIPKLFGWELQSLIFDVAVHLGTVLSVIIFFRKRIWSIVINFFKKNSKRDSARRLVLWIVIATIPAVVIGLLFGDYIEQTLRSPLVVATSLIFWGIVLWVADWYAERPKQEIKIEKTGFWKSLIIGVAQATALIPGTSRSGITVTAGLFSKFSRKSALEFSFLMSIPVILGAAVLKMSSTILPNFDVLKAFYSGKFVPADPLYIELFQGLLVFFAGMTTSFISGIVALWILWKIAKDYRFWPFALYRIVVGVALLVWLV